MVGDSVEVETEWAAGTAGEISLVRLRWGTSTVDVTEILDRWPGQGHLYLKLRGSDGATYIIRHDFDHDRWEIAVVQQGPADEIPDAPREDLPDG
jgi:hypothetical protein